MNQGSDIKLYYWTLIFQQHALIDQKKKTSFHLKLSLMNQLKLLLLLILDLPSHISGTFCMTQWEECIKHLSSILKYNDYLKEKALHSCLSWELNQLFLHGTPFLFEITTEQLAMIIQIQVFDRHFLKNEQSEPITSRKTTDSIYCQ